ncbi:hypothetical protein PoB_000815400 [Plakobranchus ocellatus]|uniref:Uncharacterized protein n=1 Tax=Plakobranchus ocellatus TaxID=259542 RepID=A0AAV3YH85_9GAST|nr:hypothetical protein PoB_000815400 [Plakobranchus ocellatus]
MFVYSQTTPRCSRASKPSVRQGRLWQGSTRDRWVTEDLRAGWLATVPPTLQKKKEKKRRKKKPAVSTKRNLVMELYIISNISRRVYEYQNVCL